jgi:hypothetical protein
MKRGSLRVSRDYKIKKWVIQGRRNGIWYNTKHEGHKLLFDLQYDACGYLQGFLDWVSEQKISPVMNSKAEISLER